MKTIFQHLKEIWQDYMKRKQVRWRKKTILVENSELAQELAPPLPALPKLYSVTVAGDRYHRMSCGNLRGRGGTALLQQVSEELLCAVHRVEGKQIVLYRSSCGQFVNFLELWTIRHQSSSAEEQQLQPLQPYCYILLPLPLPPCASQPWIIIKQQN